MFLHPPEGRTLLGDGPDFHGRAVFQHRATFGDFHRFIEVVHLEQEIAANGFLGLGKRAIGDDAPVLSRDNFACALQGLAGLDLPLLFQALKPCHKLIHGLLKLFRGKTFVPTRASEQQQIFILCLIIHFCVCFG